MPQVVLTSCYVVVARMHLRVHPRFAQLFIGHTPLGFLVGLCCQGVIDPYVSTDGWVKGWGDVSTDGVDVGDQCLR